MSFTLRRVQKLHGKARWCFICKAQHVMTSKLGRRRCPITNKLNRKARRTKGPNNNL